MKQALYFAIRRNLYNTIVAITSEKGRRRWHGRDCRYNEVTHGTFDQLLASNFKTYEEAEACRKGITEIDDRYEAQLKLLRNKINELHRDCRRDIEAFIQSFKENDNANTTTSG